MDATEDPRWLALSPERRQKLLDEHRNTQADYEWWDHTYEDFEEKVGKMGISIDRLRRRSSQPAVYFSGFGNQGDGACFDGWVSDWTKFLVAVGGYDEKFICLVTVNDLRLSWASWGVHNYSNSVRFSGELELTNPYDDETEALQFDAWNLATQNGERLINNLSSFEDFVTGLMDDLYDELEKEHDYLTSDEVIAEWLLSNLSEDELRGEEAGEEETEQV